MLELDMRLVHGIDPEDDGEFFMSEIDWNKVELILREKRTESLDFLNAVLSNR
jgi:hypothetical protein